MVLPIVVLPIMEDYLREAASLTDDQEGINNYADACLTEEAKFKNHSKDWKTGLSLADPNIQAMIAAHNRSLTLPDEAPKYAPVDAPEYGPDS